MSADYVLADLQAAEHEVPADGILTRTLCQTDDCKAVLFIFAPGQELSEHTASMPAILHVLSGQARVRLGDDTHEVRPGAWIHMPAGMKHAVRANSRVVMLLTLIKRG